MEHLIREIEAFASAAGITPQKLLRDAINAEWGRWDKWKAGEASPTLIVADRIHAYIAARRASPTPPQEDAA